MGLSWQDFAIAIVLAIVVGVIGFMIGQANNMMWLGYAGGVAGALYLIVKYMRTDES
ncbi:MAG: hypothetical protein KDC39_06995 [Actinobacteria bacterium]|nr:hypothetical protein [Actinomycetota bacterium]